MGTTYVDVTIRNPADRRRNWTGKFLVDTGAFDSLVPRRRLEEIGLQPLGQRDYVLADGKSTALDITVAEIELSSAARSFTATKTRSRCLASPPWSPVDSRSTPGTRS